MILPLHGLSPHCSAIGFALSSASKAAQKTMKLGAYGVCSWSSLALVAISAAVLDVNDELVRGPGSLELGDVPPAEQAAAGFTVALEIDRLAPFSASAKHLTDSLSTQMRSNLVLHASGSA